jgi:head-tail adaptor
MGYSAGMRRFRITVQNRKEQTQGKYGIDSKGIEWENTIDLWASVEWQRGKSAMREGALDAYAVVMVRINYSPQISMRSRIVWEGQIYQIIPETFHPDKQANTIQFHAQLIVNDL